MHTSDIESRLVAIWQELLDVRPVRLRDNFFDLGGDSVMTSRLASTIKEIWKVDLPMAMIFQLPTVEEMAAFLSGKITPKWSSRIMPLKPAGSRIPLLCVDAGPFFRHLTRRLSPDQPFFGLRLAQTRDLPTHYCLKDIAEYHIQTIRDFQPSGPYCLGGWSAGGLVAYEIAQQLQAAGEEVSLLVLFDVTNWSALREGAPREKVLVPIWRMKSGFARLAELKFEDRWSYVRAAASERYLNLCRLLWLAGDRMQRRFSRRITLAPRGASKAVFVAARRYRPLPYEGPAVLFRSAVQANGPYHDPTLGWSDLIADLDVCDMPGGHNDMFLDPYVDLLAEQLERRLSVIQAEAGRDSERAARERGQFPSSRCSMLGEL
jgi:thioesterase domain-containing protein/acyl carrier protein